MVNDKSREELIKLIKSKLFSSSHGEFKSKVQKFMTTEGRYDWSKYQKLARDQMPLESIDNLDLYWFAYAMENCGLLVEPKVFVCKVSDYFTISEIKNAKFYDKETININDLYILNGIRQLAPDQYVQ